MNTDYSWPPKARFRFYSPDGDLLFERSARGLDLADTLMLNWDEPSRDLIMGVSTTSPRWERWTKELVERVEGSIRYDLEFDAYGVELKRITRLATPCKKEFKWKVVIQADKAPWVLEEQKAERRTRRPKRVQNSRRDASITTTERTLESTFGLPRGSVKLVYPSGRKARSDATVASLKEYWRRQS